MEHRGIRFGLLVLSMLTAWVGCSSGSSSQPTLLPHTGSDRAGGLAQNRNSPPNIVGSCCIKHVVVIIQENRTLNSIFGGPKPFPNAHTTSIGYEHDGTPVTLKPVSLADTGPDIGHKYRDAIAAVNANSSGMYQMNGFDLQHLIGREGTAGTLPYKYVSYSETKPYWFMASHWALGDAFFPTEFGPSFTAHLNLIAGTDQVDSKAAAVDLPSTWPGVPTDCEAPKNASAPLLHADGMIRGSVYPCFWQFHTMADLFDKYHVSWRYYAPTVKDKGGRIWSEFDAIERVRCGTTAPISSPCMTTGADWSNVRTPANTILRDIGNGQLENVTWVVPSYANSDHQGSKSASGPGWVASIVNRIGKSKFWNSTVIVVLWDDWGGWYDEVAPPRYDFRGKAIRTPLIVISPYTIAGNNGWISHDEYEPGSILKFIEIAFKLPTLNSLDHSNVGYTDSSAKISIGHNMLDFRQKPRRFTPVPMPPEYSANYFLNQPETATPPDE